MNEDYKSLSDTELINLLQDSDHAAFTEIYRRYSYLLFVHAYKKLQDEDHAKDVTQDLFTWFWNKRESFIVGSNLAGYLYTVMRNNIFDIFAHKKVESKYIDSLNNYIAIGHTASADHLIREKELKAIIDKEIKALPAKMRVLFELSRKEQLSNREIAEKLNVTESNVYKQVNNALRILRTKLSVIVYILLLIKL